MWSSTKRITESSREVTWQRKEGPHFTITISCDGSWTPAIHTSSLEPWQIEIRLHFDKEVSRNNTCFESIEEPITTSEVTGLELELARDSSSIRMYSDTGTRWHGCRRGCITFRSSTSKRVENSVFCFQFWAFFIKKKIEENVLNIQSNIFPLPFSIFYENENTKWLK